MKTINPLPKGFVLFSERYKYTIIKVVGRGSSGIVYVANMHSAKHNASCWVALKEWASLDCCQRMDDMSISYPMDLKSEVLYRYFMEEYTILSQINHPNVIRVFDCMCTNGTYYYSMEYLCGGTLEDCIVRRNVLITENLGIRIIKQIASGLESFHQKGFVHSDIKLSNVAIRNKDSFVLIDGGANRIAQWTGAGKENLFLADIYAIANSLLCLLSGVPDMSTEYTKTDRMFAIAKERGNMTFATEQAIRIAFSAGFKSVRDFIRALDGHVESYLEEGKIPENDGVADVTTNDTGKAKEFLGGMKRLPFFFISKNYVESVELKNSDEGANGAVCGVQKLDNWFRSIQDGFVLGLRLPSPNEFRQYSQISRIKSGTYLLYDSQKVNFYIVEVSKMTFPWQKQELKIIDHDLTFIPENCRFYYVCDLEPLISDTHRMHPFAPETQLYYDKILPVSLFGFCKVMIGGKWGIVTKRDWVSMEIGCKYDKITDITYIAIPGPGIPPVFLGAIGYSGGQIDVYELVGEGHLQLKTSMTQVEWVRRSRYS